MILGQLPTYRAQHTVYEPAAIVPTKALGDLNCLVDGNAHGHILVVREFVDSQPKHIAINGGDLRNGKRRRSLFDDWVDVRELGHCSTSELLRV